MLDRTSGAGTPGEGSPERSGGDPSRAPREGLAPDPEVQPRATRRRFSAQYKLRIVREAAACREPGAIGALLRREGLYASHLADWRRQYERGGRPGLQPKKRGPRPRPRHPLEGKVAELERDKRKLERRLAEAEAIIDFPKKVHELLGIPLKRPASDGSDS